MLGFFLYCDSIININVKEMDLVLCRIMCFSEEGDLTKYG